MLSWTNTRVRALILKEILAVWRDKRSRISLIVPPVIMLLVFSFAATLEVKNVSLAILNEDPGRAAEELTWRFNGSPTFSSVRYLDAPSQIREMVDTQRALVVLRIPQDFSRRVAAGQPAEVRLILDGRRSNAAQIVQGYAARIVEQFNQDMADLYGLARPASVLVGRNWFNSNLDYMWFTVPSLVAVLCLSTGLIVSSLSVARERELGTFDQLLVSPLSPTEILVGKTVPALILGLGEGTVILLAAVLFFGVPFRGSFLLLYAGMVSFLASVIGVGLFVSSLSKTQQQAILGTFVVMVPFVLLSGFATPIENMPEWLQPVTIFVPLRYFLVIVKGVFLKDLPAVEVWANVWPMLAIAAVTLVGAGWFFRRRLE